MLGRASVGDVSEPHGVGASLVFTVLGWKPENKVLVYSLDLGDCAVPLQLQYYAVRAMGAACDSGLPADLTVFPLGASEIVDGLRLARWDLFSKRLVEWDNVAHSEEHGCITLSAPVLANQKPSLDPLRDRTYPAFLMLSDLRKGGWVTSLANIGDPHVADKDDKTISLNGLVSRKSYLRCLMCLPSLLKDGLPMLHRRQNESYYRAVLALPDKKSIEPNLKVKDYCKQLQDNGFSDKLAQGLVETGVLSVEDLPDALRDEIAPPPELDDEVLCALPAPPSPRIPGQESSCSDAESLISDVGVVAGRAALAPVLPFTITPADFPTDVLGTVIHEDRGTSKNSKRVQRFLLIALFQTVIPVAEAMYVASIGKCPSEQLLISARWKFWVSLGFG